MDLAVGDVLEMKKAHPCGKKESKCFQVLRIGIDFKLRCMGCGHEIMLPRVRAEKNIRKILLREENSSMTTENKDLG